MGKIRLHLHVAAGWEVANFNQLFALWCFEEDQFRTAWGFVALDLIEPEDFAVEFHRALDVVHAVARVQKLRADCHAPTIATTRSAFEELVDDEIDENQLLELDTREIVLPEPEVDSETDDSEDQAEPEPEPDHESENETTVASDASVTAHERSGETITSDVDSVFDDSYEPDSDETKSGVFGKVASAIGLILVGAAIGMGIYYFALTPKPAQTDNSQFSEMKAANIPLSAFEENRRSVDLDPTGYVAKFATSPQDCEDFYLLGRAYLLSGDYLRARSAFTEARNRLSEADPINSKILASDIAVALAVTSDTTIQNMLKKELEAAKPPAGPNVKPNR